MNASSRASSKASSRVSSKGSSKRSTYDALVLGSGQGGVPLAQALAAAGWKTALVEKADVGGTCVNHGCTPTKTMVASARVAHLARRAADYGVKTGKIAVDLARVRRRKREIVERFREGSERELRRARGLELVSGKATFVGRREVRVDSRGADAGRVLRAKKIFVNVGCRPRRATIPGIETVRALDSTSIMELAQVPRRLAVLGGGYVGLEFGQMFRRFGSAVTIVQHGARLLDREDDDVSRAVESILREDGVDVLLRSEVRSVRRLERGRIGLDVRTPKGRRPLVADELLVATGRAPNTDDLGAQAAGIELDSHGFILVNDRLETSAPGIYALGDVKGGPAFTHISYDDYRILEANLLRGGRSTTIRFAAGNGGRHATTRGRHATTRGRFVPYTVYLDPQLGRVGMSEREARATGRRIRVAKMPMSHVARALETDETRGFMKVVVDAKSRQILGAAVLGIEGGEIMSALQIAMMGRLPYTALRDATFAHPTLMEALNNLFFAFEG